MNDRKRIEELERRVRELEARPIVYPAIIVLPAPAAAPVYPLYPTWPGMQPHPFGEPWIIYGDGHMVIS